MGGGPRDVAEHFMELHSSRILADDRNRHHSPPRDYMHSELKVDDVISYLERLRERVERVAPPSRRTQETQTVPAALLPVTSTFLLQELPSAPAQQHLHQVCSLFIYIICYTVLYNSNYMLYHIINNHYVLYMSYCACVILYYIKIIL